MYTYFRLMYIQAAQCGVKEFANTGCTVQTLPVYSVATDQTPTQFINKPVAPQER